MAQLQTTAVTGSLTVTGNITAQTLVVQTITSSVSVVTGSTQFGSLTSNTHQFTGSIYQSGSEAIFGNNVSIGTTTSISRLTVLSDSSALGISMLGRAADGISHLRWYNNAGNTIYTAIESNANYTIYNTVTNGYAAFLTNNTERMRITSGGNVGIGTTSPGGLLHLDSSNSGATGQQMLRITRSSASQGIKLMNYDGSTGVDGYSLKTIGDIDLIHFKMTDGNVGIGHTSPAVKLDVAGVIATRISAFTYSTIDGASDGNLYITANAGQANTTNSNTIFRYSTSGGGITESMRISNVGNVGIGTTSASRKLTIVDTNAQIRISDGTANTYWELYSVFFQSNQDFSIQNQNGSALLINSVGNVGIGTTTPAQKLQIVDSTSFTSINVYNSKGSSGGTSAIMLGLNDGTFVTNDAARMEARIISNPNSALDFKVYGSSLNTIMTLLGTGNVGIGTTNPTVKLDVISSGGSGMRIIDSTAPNFYINNTVVQWKLYLPASSNDFRINDAVGDYVTIKYNSGNVGIGTTSPLFNLQVGANAGTIATTTIRLQNSYLNVDGAYGFNIDAVDNGIDGHDLRFLGRTTPYGGFSELVRIKNGGNVLIGSTNNPGNKIIAYQNATFNGENSYAIAAANASATGKKIMLGYDNSLDIGLLAAVDTGIAWKNISIPYGNVGIGTTAPNVKLRVEGNTILNGSVSANTTYNAFALNVGGTAYIIGGHVWVNDGYGYANASSVNTGMFPDSSHNITFKNNNSTTVYIKSGGSVGIGTTSPSSLLSVQGNTDLGNSLGSTTSSTYTTRISGYAMRYDASNRYGNYGLLILNADSGWTASARRFMITNGLNVNKFAIIRSVDSTTDPAFGDGGAISSGTADFVITSNGNVGIGSTSPAFTLDVAGDIGINGRLFAFNSATYTQITDPAGGIKLYLGASGDPGNYYDNTSHNFRSIGGSTVYTTINSTGVGISTTSPAYKLDVRSGAIYVAGGGFSGPDGENGYRVKMYDNGGTHNDAGIGLDGSGGGGEIMWFNALSGFYFNYGTGGVKIKFDANGNVGIGTTSPSTLLHVAGTIRTGGNGAGYVEGYRTIWETPDSHRNVGANAYQIENVTSQGLTIGYSSNQFVVVNTNGNVGIGTTSVGQKFVVYGGPIRLNANSSYGTLDEYIYTVYRTVAANSNYYTEIGSISTNGQGQYATIEISHHDCGTIEYSKFELIANYYSGATTDWVQLPSRTQAHYAGDRNGVVVDARLASTGASIELRLRSLGGACGNMGVTVKITSNTPLTESSGTGTGASVAGLLGFNRYEFPVINNRFGATTQGLFIQPDGNVGIGTTSPQSKAHVTFQSDFDGLRIQNSGRGHNYLLTTAGSSAEYFSIYDLDNSQYLYQVSNDNGHGFLTSGSTRMAITSNGNVGIGTTSPNYKLKVEGDLGVTSTGRFSGVLFSDSRLMVGTNYADQTYASVFVGGALTTGTNQYALLLDPQLAGTNNYGLLANARIKASTAVTNAYGVYILNNELLSGASITNNYGLYIANQTNGTTNYALYSAGGTVYFAGNVGIGTTSPGYKLDVQGNAGLVTFNTNGAIQAGTEIIAGSGNFASNSSGTDVVIRAGITTLMTLKSGGNIGIGTTNPGYKLHVSGNLYVNNGVSNGSGVSLFVQGSGDIQCTDGGSIFWGEYSYAGGTYIRGYDASDAIYFYSNGTNISYFKSDRAIFNGNVGIGTTAPGSLLQVGGSGATATATPTAIQLDNSYRNAVGGNTSLKFYLYKNSTETYGIGLNNAGGIEYHSGLAGDAGSYQAFYFGNSEKIRFKGDGNVGIGTTSPAYALDVTGTIRATGDVIAYSDARVKENVETITDALDKVTSLRGVSYTRKDSEDKSRKVGVIAQEVLDILPEVVQQDAEGNYSVAYGNIVGVLIEAIKELKAEINELKNNK